MSAPPVRRNLLFRRREVWLPTAWGWLLLLIVVSALAATLLLNANRMLASSEPARGPDGSGARTLVVEGWLDRPELQQAVAAFRRGRYDRVLTTGGPMEGWEDTTLFPNYALRAADYLRTQGLADVPVIAVPAPATKQDRTYLSALMVRDWAQQSGVKLDAIDLYSADVHARRSRLVFRMALGPEVEIGVLAAQPTLYDPVRWWTSSIGAKATMGEIVGIAWTMCCFWPGPRDERGATPPGAASAPPK